MTDFPLWVPADVVQLYQQLQNREQAPGLPKNYFDNPDRKKDIACLFKLIESQDMQKSWKAISKRTDRVPPNKFAINVLKICGELRWVEHVPTAKDVAALDDLAAAIQDAETKYLQSTGITLVAIHRALEEIGELRKFSKDQHNDFRDYSAKQLADSAEQTFLVRRLAECVSELYNQPLYDVVRTTVAVITGRKPLEKDHVRKLVKLRQKRIRRK